MMINNKMKVGLTVRIFTVILVWVVLLAWPDSGRTAENAVIPLSVDTAAVNPSPHITYLLDAAGNLTITDVLSMGFSPLPSGVANFGFTTDKIWLKFTVQNESDREISRILATSARFMRPLEIFIERFDGSIERLLYNDETQRFGERPLPEFRFLAAEFILSAQESATFWIRFGAGGQASMTFQITDRESVLTDQYQATLSISIFAAVLVTLILVNFFHFVAVRNIAYLVYVVYESFNLIYVSHMDGFTWQYLWPNSPWFNADATPIIAGLGLVVGNVFGMVFLETWKYTPRLHKALLGLVGISTIILITTIFVENRLGNQLTAPVLPLSLIFNVIVAIFSMRAGHYLARYFVAAWSLFAVFALVWSGSILGFLAPTFDLLAVYKIIIASQAIILSMGLADQVRRLNNQYVDTQGSLIANLQGRLEDARERLRLEKENENTMLQLLQKSKLLASTSHDINQPIQSLRLAIEGLGRASPDIETTRQLGRTLDHMESVLGSALDEASEELKRDTQSTPVQSVAVQSLIEEVTNQFKDQADQKKIAIRGVHSNSIIVTSVMPLKRCLLNLISNAVKATDTGGVLLGARRRGNQLLFQVFDTGAGFPEQELESILQPLVSGDESAGHGLGLAIVSETCAEYGWQLMVRSTPGRGSCFSIVVPVRV